MIADTHPNQPQGRKADRSGHPPHLAVATFTQRQAEPTGGDVPTKTHRWVARPQPVRLARVLRDGGQRRAVVQCDASTKRCQGRIGDLAFDLHQGTFDIDEDALAVGVQYTVAVTRTALQG